MLIKISFGLVNLFKLKLVHFKLLFKILEVSKSNIPIECVIFYEFLVLFYLFLFMIINLFLYIQYIYNLYIYFI